LSEGVADSCWADLAFEELESTEARPFIDLAPEDSDDEDEDEDDDEDDGVYIIGFIGCFVALLFCLTPGRPGDSFYEREEDKHGLDSTSSCSYTSLSKAQD
jgi:hypothetical protein